MKRENEIILLSTLHKKTKAEKMKLEELLREKNDWAYIVGELVCHRLCGYFYYGIGQSNFEKLEKEFRTLVYMQVRLNEKIYNERYLFMKNILNDLEERGVRYAGLKGMIYPVITYEEGIRYSGDWDLLVEEGNLEILDEVLRKYGLVESNDRGITEASKKEKLIQRMNYHDLVPYFTQEKLIYQDYIKIDVNTQFDSVKNEVTKDVLNYGTELYEKNGKKIRGLNIIMHFLHLCVHFYREASSTLWTEKRYDVTLYKIVDVVNTYRYLRDEDIIECIKVAKKLNLNKHIYFTFYYLYEFYHDPKIKELVEMIELEDTTFLKQIKVEGTDKYQIREEEFIKKTFDLVKQL